MALPGLMAGGMTQAFLSHPITATEPRSPVILEPGDPRRRHKELAEHVAATVTPWSRFDGPGLFAFRRTASKQVRPRPGLERRRPCRRLRASGAALAPAPPRRGRAARFGPP
ncbi:hypothetical protein GCM10020218_013730 [Dactylosporangium vinaceum]